MHLYCISPFDNAIINHVILSSKFHSFRLALNSIFFCYKQQMIKNGFVHFTAPRRLKTAAPVCLPLQLPQHLIRWAWWLLPVTPECKAFIVKMSNWLIKYQSSLKMDTWNTKFQGTRQNQQTWRYIKPGIVRAGVNTSRVYRRSVKDLETRSVKGLERLVYWISLNKDWHKEVI